MRQLPALTGLRFFAAFEVVVFHLGRADHWPLPAPIRAFGSAGFLAVTLFFVLSGFILTYTYLAPEAPRTSGLDLYLARLARIYPVYLFGLVIAAPIFVGVTFMNGVTPEATRTLAAQSATVLLMAQAYVPEWALAWNPPAWSISVEMFFYISFPLLAPRLVSMERRRAITVAASCWAAAALAAIIYTAFGPSEDVLHHPWRSVIDYFPLVRLPDFVVGIVAGRIYLESRERPPPPKMLRALLLLGIAVPAAVVASSTLPELILHGSLLAPFFAAAIFSLAFGSDRLSRFLGWKPIVALGDASYALYILHVPIMMWLFFIGEKIVHRKLLEEPAIILATMAGLVILSLGVYRGIEAPLRKRLRTLLISGVHALSR